MESQSLPNKLEPSIYQGTPSIPDTKKAVPVSPIRTMKSDMDLAVKTQNETLVSIAIAEEKKQARLLAEKSELKVSREIEPPTAAPRPLNRMIVVILGLLFVGILIAVYILLRPRLSNITFPDITFPSFDTANEPTTNIVPAVVALSPSLIPAQAEKRIDITASNIGGFSAELQAEKNLGLPMGTIKNIFVTDSREGTPIPLSAKKLIALTNISTPDILSRSLESNFMMGFHGEEGGRAIPFLMIKVSSREGGIAGMLEWEENLPGFFSSLFGTYTPKSNDLPAKFKDKVVMGRDTRILNDAYNPIVYVFANSNTIIISQSVPTLEKLLLVSGTAPLK